MRYEAKHSFLKQMAHAVKNFKNIPKSLANHHQKFMSYQMADSSTYLTSEDLYGPGT